MLRQIPIRAFTALWIPGFILLAILAQQGTGQKSPGNETPQPTVKSVHGKGWWPTRRDAARNDFVGTEACAPCHKQQVLEQQQTPMAQAAWKASETEVLRSSAQISNTTPPFATEIARDRKGSTYTVARGGDAMSGQVLWSMGDNVMGQTFMLQSGANLYESQLSYFKAIAGLDLTPGHVRASPQNLDHAFGALQTTESAQQCFGCHTTASSTRGTFDQAKATPGITCEACHGPGASHVKSMQDKQGDAGQTSMLDPRAFGPVQMLDYCGACHRAALDVIDAKDFLPINVRFQPYRLSKSRCWSRPDKRITCTACHNPHQQLVRDSGFYDSKCLACHAPASVNAASGNVVPDTAKPLPVCRVATRNCVSCHMPRYQVPEMHGAFTDHDIRIVRPGDAFPL